MNLKIASVDDTVKIIDEKMRSLGELVKLARIPGNLVDHLSDKIKEDVDKGPIAEIRTSYALRGAVEKEILKVQNA